MAEPIRSSGWAPITKRARRATSRLAANEEYALLRAAHDAKVALPEGERMKRTTASTPFGTRLPNYRRKAARSRSGRWTQ
jgi:hypothetical protein